MPKFNYTASDSAGNEKNGVIEAVNRPAALLRLKEIGLIASAALIVAYFPIMVGDVDGTGAPAFGAVSWFLLALIALFPALGFVQAWWIKNRRPAAYTKLTDSIAG